MKPYYQDDAVTIYHGDCRAILPQLEPVDLVLTDPPYGIGAKLGMGGGYKGDGGMWRGVKIDGDESLDARDDVVSMIGDLPYGIFCSPRTAWPAGTETVLVWDKGEHVGAGDLRFPWKPNFEFICLRGTEKWRAPRRDSSVLRFNACAGCVGNRNDGFRHHPFEKPVELLAYMVSRSWTSLILDPFMGSGTTLRAAKDLGRKAIGIEIEEKYCEIAAKRMAQEVLAL